jgi:Regulator of Ty1 transposition protein 107 BRCT domain/BRCT domain, a BRCA1 C-terminus domain
MAVQNFSAMQLSVIPTEKSGLVGKSNGALSTTLNGQSSSKPNMKEECLKNMTPLKRKASLKEDFKPIETRKENSEIIVDETEKTAFVGTPLSKLGTDNNQTVKKVVGIMKRKNSSHNLPLIPPNVESVGMNAAFTGLRLLAEEEAIFESLKIRITDNISNATVLVAEKISRTEKFLLAISHSVPIVSTSWKDRVVNDKKIVSLEDYLLCDPEGEKALGFSLKKSVKISKESNIFKGITFYCTSSVLPAKATILKLVEANGGDFGEQISRRNVLRIKEELESFDGEVVCLSALDDSQLIEKLGRPCYNTEWLLDSILKQENKNLDEYQLDSKSVLY